MSTGRPPDEPDDGDLPGAPVAARAGAVDDDDDDGSDPIAELPASTGTMAALREAVAGELPTSASLPASVSGELGTSPSPDPYPSPDPTPFPSPDPYPSPSPSPTPFPSPDPNPALPSSASPSSSSPSSPSSTAAPAKPAKPDKPAKPAKAPKPKRADTADDDGALRPRRRWPLYLAGLATVGAAIAVMVVIGQVHASQYALRCHAKVITAERGRSFPPWGYERLGGATWKPIAIPADVECTPRETDNVVQLEGWYLEALVEQATRKLAGAAPGDLDRAEAELEQALLLSRSPERRDQRKELERLRGDVTYWRAAAKVKAAVAMLEDAAARFDEASAQRPRHASDPSRWAGFARAAAASLGAGPDGAGVPSPIGSTPGLGPAGVPNPSRPSAPPGVALPVDPQPYQPDAGVTPDAARSDLPSGGVLM